jgi:predicted RNA-binding Zn-ribbon protein involved in translation (DUF1610 family)
VSEISALDKLPCAACGAQAEWNVARQRLVCPFCGTESPYTFNPQTGVVEELDLLATLREMPDDERGWQASTRSVQCQSCKAVMVFEAARVGQNCEFCGSPALVSYDEVRPPIRPQSLMPFRISEAQVRETIRHWYASKWLAPSTFKRRALVDTLHGLYIPYWTFDAHVRCPWRAQAGYYYYVQQGKNRVRRVRWQPASGIVEHFFDDVLIPGTTGIPHHLLAQVEPFGTQGLVPYDTGYLSGHVVEHYQVVLGDAAQMALRDMEAELRALCVAQIPGDTYQGLQMSPEWSGRTFKHILVPVYLLSYVYKGRTYTAVVNGVTGRMGGSYPLSWVKIALLVLAVLVVLAVLATR